MNAKTLTLDLPASVYDTLEKQAQKTRRTIAQEIREILVRNLEDVDYPAEHLFPELASLRSLDDQALRAVAERWLPNEISEKTEELNRKHQREGLTEQENATLGELLREYDKHLLMRAEAAVLLKQRGHDISFMLKRP